MPIARHLNGHGERENLFGFFCFGASKAVISPPVERPSSLFQQGTQYAHIMVDRF
jgi:hypothetical protein